MPRSSLVTALVTGATIIALAGARAWAQPQAAMIAPQQAVNGAAPTTYRVTLEQARQQVLSNSKLLKLAALNVQSKGHATSAARADFFPKIVGNTLYLHFTDPLGKVITTKNHPVLGIPPMTVVANVANQDSSFTSVLVFQPITDLLKVRDGVRIAKADEQIAQAQLDQGARELQSGVEQLYWGLLAAQRIRGGVLQGYRGAQEFAKLGTVEARTALVEAEQGLQQVEVQVADLQEQFDILLDVPTCTVLELIEPPFPTPPVTCADDAIDRALAASPELREAAQNIAKAQAATHAAQLDFMPSIVAMGGFTNQTAASYIQQNFGYIGVMGSYTFVDWGKRRNIIQEREHLIGMATLKLRQTQDDIRQKTLKAYRGLFESHRALSLANGLVGLRKEAEAKAHSAAQTNPVGLLDASKARGVAEVDLVKADLAYRQAHVELSRLIGQ
jgi:outer membrane protein